MSKLGGAVARRRVWWGTIITDIDVTMSGALHCSECERVEANGRVHTRGVGPVCNWVKWKEWVIVGKLSCRVCSVVSSHLPKI